MRRSAVSLTKAWSRETDILSTQQMTLTKNVKKTLMMNMKKTNSYDKCLLEVSSDAIYQENCPQEDFYDSNYFTDTC
mgnify:CR=1 FL=1